MAKAKTPSVLANKNDKLPYLEQRVPVFIANQEHGDNPPIRLQNGTDVCFITPGRTVMVKRKFALQLEEISRAKAERKKTLMGLREALEQQAKQSEVEALNR